VAKEDAHLKCTLADGSRVFGEDGTIFFLANGKVAVGVGGRAFEKQKKKVISRFKVNPVLLEELEADFQPPFDGRSSQFLQGITQITDQARFDRQLDALARYSNRDGNFVLVVSGVQAVFLRPTA
jgi:hypothetical protein